MPTRPTFASFVHARRLFGTFLTCGLLLCAALSHAQVRPDVLWMAGGHLAGNDVGDIAFSQDGTLVATAGKLDGTAKIWRTSDGSLLRTIDFGVEVPNIEPNVFDVAFSPDGSKLAAVGVGQYTGAVQVWSTVTGQLLQSRYPSGDVASSVAYTPDGTRLVIAGPEGATILDADTLATIQVFTEFPAANLYAVALSPDGRWLAYCNHLQTIIRSTSDFGIRATIPFGSSAAALAFSGDSAEVGIVTGGGAAQIFKIDGTFQQTLGMGSDIALAIAFNPAAKRAAVGFTSASQDIGSSNLYRSIDGTSMVSFGPGRKVRHLTFSPDGARIGAVSFGFAGIIASSASLTPKNLLQSTKPILAVDISGDSKRIASTDSYASLAWSYSGALDFGVARVRSLVDGSVVRAIPWSPTFADNGGNIVSSVSLNGDGTLLAVANYHNAVVGEDDARVYRVSDGSIVQRFIWPGHPSLHIDDVTLSSDGQLLMAFNVLTATVRMFRVSDGFQYFEAPATHVLFARDARFLATWHQGTLKLLNPLTGTSLMESAADAFNDWAFSPTGKYLALGENYNMRILSLPDLSVVRSFITTSNVNKHIAFAGTDRIIASYNGTRLSMYEVATAIKLKEFNEENRGITAFASAPDGQVLAWGRRDATIVAARNPFAYMSGSLGAAVPSKSIRTKPVFLRLLGNDFEAGDTFVLRQAGQPDIVPIGAVHLNSPWRLEAELDLRTAALGHYDIVLQKLDGRVLVGTQFFEVISGSGAGELRVSLETLDTVRADRSYVTYLEYENVGSAPMDAPLLTASSARMRLRLSRKDKWTAKPLQILGIGVSPDAAKLYPGQHQRIPIYFHTNNFPPTQDIIVSKVVGMDPAAYANNWELVKATVVGLGYPNAAAWDPIWLAFIAQYGNDFSTHLTALRTTAAWLADQGEQVYDVHKLMNFAMAKATGDASPVSTLDSSVDAAEATPGLPLRFVRFAPTGLGRFRPGPLGKGWAHNYQYKLTHVDADITIIGPGGNVRKFSNVLGTEWQGDQGDNGKLVVETNGEYKLQESDGTVSLYGTLGVLQWIRDRNGNRLTMSYDASGRLIAVEHSNGMILQMDYSAGLISRVSDSSGRETEYVYDPTNVFLKEVHHPGSRVSMYSYNPSNGSMSADALTQVVGPDGTQRNFLYDSLGKLIRISPLSDPGDNRWSTRFGYGVEGSSQVINAEGKTWTTSNGTHGLPVKSRDPLGNTASTQYGVNLDPIRQTSPRGFVWTGGFDTKGNQIESVDPLGGILKLGYTPDHNRLKWLRDRRGNEMNFGFDVLGNVTKITYADGKFEEFEYDGCCFIRKWTNRRGMVVLYERNDRAQLTKITRPDGRVSDYVYDARGNLLQALDTLTGVIAMNYNDRDYLTRIEHPGGKWFEYDYTPDGRRLQRRGDDGFVVNYSYDPIGRLAALRDGANALIIQYSYDDTGRLSREAKGNGTYTTYTYDPASRVREIRHFAPDNSLQTNFVYTYDADGNPSRITGSRGAYEYDYDSTGQVVAARYPNGSYEQFSYDAEGNRITANNTGTITPYSTNNMNQYLSAGGSTFTHDDDGNMTSKTEAGVRTDYEYDVENRLVRVTTPGDEWIYRHDAAGNRSSSVHNGLETRYLHDGVLLASELNSAGTLSARYVQGLGLVARQDATASGYYSFDAVGNTRAITQGNGQVANSYDFNPFGDVINQTESIPNIYKFGGEHGVSDHDNGLAFMRSRYFAAKHGRFLSPDRLGIGGGDSNLYRYVSNRPLSFVDPSGFNAIKLKQCVRDCETIANWKLGGAGLIVGGIGACLSPVPPLALVGGAAAGLALVEIIKMDRWKCEDTCEQTFKPDTVKALGGSGGGSGGSGGASCTTGGGGGGGTGGGSGGAGGSAGGGFGGFATLEEYLKWLLLVLGAIDPNEKRGPEGTIVDNKRYLKSLGTMEFTVLFENKPADEAGNQIAHAQRVLVTDNLSSDLDWTTMELQGITFANQTISDFGGFQFGHLRVPLAPPTNLNQASGGQQNPDNSHLVVDIDATFDAAAGKITWTLQTIDPLTELPPDGVYEGILAPNGWWSGTTFNNYGDGRGEGKLVFRIKPKPRPDGTYLENKASIVFDTNAPIITDPFWSATLDTAPPNSQVFPLPSLSPSRKFSVRWGGSDPGSGIGKYEIYLSKDGAAYTLWHQTEEAGAKDFFGESGSTYRFYSRAIDKLGHRETAPTLPDAITFIADRTAFAETVQVIAGYEFAGGLGELLESDDLHFSLFNDDITLIASVEISGSFPLPVPSFQSITCTLEAGVNRTGLAQTIQFYSNTTNQWTSVNGTTASLNDSTINFTVSSNPARFVNEVGVIKARVLWLPINDEDPAQDGWLHRVDFVKWTVEG